jgi:hypothetical protein
VTNKFIPHSTAISIEDFNLLGDEHLLSANQICGTVLWCSISEWIDLRTDSIVSVYTDRLRRNFVWLPLEDAQLFTVKSIKSFIKLNPSRFGHRPTQEAADLWKTANPTNSDAPRLVWKQVKEAPPQNAKKYRELRMTEWVFDGGYRVTTRTDDLLKPLQKRNRKHKQDQNNLPSDHHKAVVQ